jgi:hypothetical protein
MMRETAKAKQRQRPERGRWAVGRGGKGREAESLRALVPNTHRGAERPVDEKWVADKALDEQRRHPLGVFL